MTPEEFRALRKRLGLTQTKLGEALGVKWRAIQRYESGERNISDTVELLLRRLLEERAFEGGSRTVVEDVRRALRKGPREPDLKFARRQVMQLTAVFRKVREGYIGFVEEIPGTNTQAATLQEARRNLQEAVRLVLDANRTLSEEGLRGTAVIREALRLPEQ
jgi:predicted RNase H-like HicB family nuclease